MKKILCVFLSLVLVLAAAGCSRQYDPQMKAEDSDSSQSQPESSQPAPEPIAPEPIMPVPASEPDPEPEPEPEPDPEPEDEDEDDEDGEDEDGEDEEDEEGDEEDEEEGEGFDPPEVPHGSDLSWLDLNTVTVSELKPLLDQILARADYFCQFGRAGTFSQAVPDKTISIKRAFRSNDVWTYYAYTNIPYHTMDELEAGLLTTFSWDVRDTEMFFLFEILTDDGNYIYYADEVMGLNKARTWDTDRMTITDRGSRKITLTMPVTWRDVTFESELTLQLWDGYLVLAPNYFALDESQKSSH